MQISKLAEILKQLITTDSEFEMRMMISF